MCETLRAEISQSTKYVWICSNKVQYMHELFLSCVWNWLNMSTNLNVAEEAIGTKYALIYMNMSNVAGSWIFLNLPKDTRIWANLNISNVMNMAMEADYT